MSTPKVGLHKGVSRTVYGTWGTASNQSVVKVHRKSAAHVFEEMQHPKASTPALVEGDAIHACILEPSRWKAEYVAGLDRPRRSADDKQAWLEFEHEHSGKIILTAKQYENVGRIAGAVWEHPTARTILSGAGTNEIGLVWEDVDLGVLCKALVDRLTKHDGRVVAVDLKSAQDASEDAWPRACVKYGYDVQAAFYIDGLHALSPAERGFLMLVIEKKPPYAIKVYEPFPSVLEVGRVKYKRWLAKHAECLKSGIWPGYAEGVTMFHLPEWAYKEMDDDG